MSKPLVLVTGASGFIAGHVIRQTLEDGFRIRGTVRSVSNPDKYQYLYDMGDVELVEANLMSDAGWDEAVKGVDYILHTASPFQHTGTEEEVVRPAVDGTRRVLEAAANEPNGTIKRVVVTSSMVAISSGNDKPNNYTFTAADWTNLDTAAVYPKSKTLAEKFVWEFAESDQCDFEVVTVNPGFVVGPLCVGRDCESASFVRRVFEGMMAIPNICISAVDVRDVALVHSRALTAKEAPGKRLLSIAKSMWWPDIADALAAVFVPLGYNVTTYRVPDWFVSLYGLIDSDAQKIASDLSCWRQFDKSETERITGIEFRNIEESFIAMAESNIAFGLLPKPEPSDYWCEIL